MSLFGSAGPRWKFKTVRQRERFPFDELRDPSWKENLCNGDDDDDDGVLLY